MMTSRTYIRRIGKTAISLVLAFLLAAAPLFGLKGIPVHGEVGNPELTDPSFEILDGEDDDGNLVHTEPVTLRVTFGVPVIGDGGDDYFEQDDTIEMLLSEHFFFDPPPVGTIELLGDNDVLVGHVTLGNNANNQATAFIVLDGDPDVFNGEWEEVSACFMATLAWNGTFEEDDEGNAYVRILEKQVDFLFPGQIISHSMAKSGALSSDGSKITWTVVIEAVNDLDPPEHVDLAGYVFTDNLTGVGDFVAGSFSLDANLEPNTSNVLTYTFPSGSTSPQTITFETEVSDYILTNGGTVSNTARLQEQDTTVVFDSGSVTIPAPQFTKTGETGSAATPGGIYNPDNRTIIWTVEVDSGGRLLADLAITDLLASGLTFVSAEWQVYTGGTPPWQSTSPATTWSAIPTNSRYEIGDFNGRGRLVIVTEAPTPASGFVVDTSTYRNQASVTWTGTGGAPGSGQTGNPGVTTGYTALSKTAGTLNQDNHQIPWTVTADLAGQGNAAQLATLSLYDLIVHDAATPNASLTGATGWPAGLTIGSGGVHRNNGQKYVTGSLTAAAGSSHLTVTAIELYSGASHIGTLIRATGLVNTINSIQFITQVIDPEMLAGNNPTNSPARARNTATLTSGTTRLGTAEGSVVFPNQILSKELLHRDEVHKDNNDDDIDANNRTVAAGNGFHYGYKEVIFRFNINAAGLDFENVETSLPSGFGAVTVTDTLPEGWEFVPFENGGADFLLYAGGNFQSGSAYPPYGSLVANGDPIDLALNDDIVTAVFDYLSDPQTVAFTFTELKSPYVLLIKARPTGDTLDGYLLDNQASTETNTLNLKTANWTPGKDATQDVIVDGTVLHKTVFIDDTLGVARWTIEYTPLDRPVDIGLEDTLPLGIDLRTDSSGNLLWLDENGDRNITVTELVPDGSGAYIPGDQLSQDDHESYVTYNPETRILEFTFPDNTKGYRLVYLTDITGAPGYVSNEVRLISEEVAGVTDHDGFWVLSSHGLATMTRSAFMIIRKTTSDGVTLLRDAEFTLYFTDDEGNRTAVKAIKTTGDDGLVTFYGLAAGTYVLVETLSPSGYQSNTDEYTVTVLPDRTVMIGGCNCPYTIRNFLEEEPLGDLTLSKTVAGNAGETNRPFTFTIEFRLQGEVVLGVFGYTGVNGGPSGTISSGGSIELQHGQSVEFTGLPVGLEYSIVEEEANEDGYVTIADSASGVIAADQTSQAAFTNTRNQGQLNIIKSVQGNAGDPGQAFEFQVYFEGTHTTDLPYTGINIPDGTISNGDIIQLAHGQGLTIDGLLDGTLYEVIELDADQDGYITSSENETGAIMTDTLITASFVNTKNLGVLSIHKTVEGVSGETDRPFTFELTLTDPEGLPLEEEFTYTGIGVPGGSITSGGQVQLAHGQEITISGLPLGTLYQVVELEADEDDYETAATGDSGTFTSDDFRKYARFVNTNDTRQMDDDDIPKTGDQSSLATLALFIGSLLLLVLLVGTDFYLRKKKASR